MVCRGDVALISRDVSLTINSNPGQKEEKDPEDGTE